MKSKPNTAEDREANEIIEALFDASESVYHSTIKFLANGNRLEAGERAPVAIAFETAMTAIEYGVPCPAWAKEAVVGAWHGFEEFRFGSISEAFQIPKHKQRAARRDELLCAAVYHRVRALQKHKIPLKDNANGKGALSIVGERYHISGKKAEKLMERWKGLCRQTGTDPNASIVGLADAKQAIAAAIARGLTAWDPTS